MSRGRSPRWRRNQRLKCVCGGYHFPHRKAGGACDHSPTQRIHIAKRGGNRSEIEAAIFDYRLSRGVVQQPGAECPF